MGQDSRGAGGRQGKRLPTPFSSSSDDFFLYRPDADYNGSDSFSYSISDGKGGSDTVSVSVTVNSVNDAPYAEDDHAVTSVNTTITLDVTANDSDADEDNLDLVAVGTPLHGSASIDGGNIRYTPASGYTGIDSFTYTIEDEDSVSRTGKVFITVHGSGQWASTLEAEKGVGSLLHEPCLTNKRLPTPLFARPFV